MASAYYGRAPAPESYGSLIAKVAAYNLQRDGAVERMRVALNETVIEGVRTTLPVHQAVLEDERFLRGSYHRQFLDEMLSDWKTKSAISFEELAAIYLTVKSSKCKV